MSIRTTIGRVAGMAREARTVLGHWYAGALTGPLTDSGMNPSVARSLTRPMPSNFYEAGWPLLDGDHSFIPSLIQDARFDQPPLVRREILRKSRFFAQNTPLFKRILDIQERYTVGPHGLLLTSDSADEDWADRANDVLAEMFEHAGLNDEPLSVLFQVGHADERVDGEAFMVKTRKKTKQGSVPRIQLVEAHRVETPFSKWAEDGDKVIDGVQLDLAGNREGYWVREGNALFDGNASWNLLPGDSRL